MSLLSFVEIKETQYPCGGQNYFKRNRETLILCVPSKLALENTGQEKGESSSGLKTSSVPMDGLHIEIKANGYPEFLDLDPRPIFIHFLQ